MDLLILNPHNVAQLPASRILNGPVCQHCRSLVPTAFLAVTCTNLHYDVTGSRGFGTLVY